VVKVEKTERVTIILLNQALRGREPDRMMQWCDECFRLASV